MITITRELEDFILTNEKRIKLLNDNDKNILSSIFLKGFELVNN